MDHKKTKKINALPPLRRRKVLAGFASIAGLAAVGGMPTLAQAAGDTVLRVRAPANPSSLDPATGGSGSDHLFLYNYFDTLVDWEPATLAPKPGLAKEWSFTDPKTLVLKLEKGVVFHDGTACDAAAVKFNLDRNRTAKISNIKRDVASIVSVEVTDTQTVTLHLSEPDTALPLILSDRAGMMVSPTALGNDPEADMNRSPVGTGAWKFVSWTDGEKTVGARNETHWREDAPGVDGIEMLIIPEEATGLRAVQSGQVHIAIQLSERQKVLVDKLPNLSLVSGPTLFIHQLFLNAGRGPLQDPRVRRALSLALNRDAFVAATQGQVGEPAYMNLPKSHWAWSEEAAKLTSYDPEQAKALLAEAGYGDGVEFDFRGFPDQGSVQRQEVLLAQWKEVGIHGRFQNAPIPENSGRFFGTEKQGDFLLAAWTGRPDPSLTYSLLYSESSYFNAGRAAPPEGFEEALQASRETSDQAARAEALNKVQVLAMESMLTIPLAVRYEIDATTASVSGFEPNLLGKPKFNDVKLG